MLYRARFCAIQLKVELIRAACFDKPTLNRCLGPELAQPSSVIQSLEPRSRWRLMRRRTLRTVRERSRLLIAYALIAIVLKLPLAWARYMPLMKRPRLIALLSLL